MRELEFTADKEMLLSDFLMKEKGVSRRLVTKLKRQENGITRNGEYVRTIDKIFAGDIIRLKLSDEKQLEGNSNLNVKVAFENDSVVILDKPVGMPVHPSIKHQGDTLGNFFAATYPDLTFRPVNRLDRDTSGLCVIAKDAYSAAQLQGETEKIYYAVVCGVIKEAGTVNASIKREQDSIIKRIVADDGQWAVTHYTPIGGNEKYTLLKINLETGRTHQIRVHMAYMGFPLAGDDMYGGNDEDIKEQALHCGEIIFCDPVTKEKINVKSEIREDMKNLIK